MEPVILTDASVFPDDAYVFSLIGDKQKYWQTIMNHLYSGHGEITEERKFYNDGKCWLFRTLQKKKTIFWIGIIDKGFRISFYLPDQARSLIEQSNLPINIKEEFAAAKSNRFGRALTIVVNSMEEVDAINILVEIKLMIK